MDDRFKKSLPRSGTGLGQGEQGELHRGFGERSGKVPGTAHPGEMGGTAGHGLAHRMRQQHPGANGRSRLLHRGLMGEKRDAGGGTGQDATPAALGKKGLELGRGQAQFDKIGMGRQGQPGYGPGHAHGLGGGQIRRRTGMRRGIGRAKKRLGLGVWLGGPGFADGQHSQHEAFSIAKGQTVARGQGVAQPRRHIEADRPGHDPPVGQAHGGQHAFEIGPAKIAGQRIERPVEQQFEDKELVRAQAVGRVSQGSSFDFLGPMKMHQKGLGVIVHGGLLVRWRGRTSRAATLWGSALPAAVRL